MEIDLRGARLQIAFEGGILDAHRLPVEAELANRFGIKPGVAHGMAQRFNKRAEAGLRGQARHRIHRRVDRIDAGLDGGEHAGGRNPRCVMRVEMDRQT